MNAVAAAQAAIRKILDQPTDRQVVDLIESILGKYDIDDHGAAPEALFTCLL